MLFSLKENDSFSSSIEINNNQNFCLNDQMQYLNNSIQANIEKIKERYLKFVSLLLDCNINQIK